MAVSCSVSVNSSIYEGQSVTAKVVVKNKYSKSYKFAVTVSRNSRLVLLNNKDEEYVNSAIFTLAAGASKTLTFSIKGEYLGTAKLTFDVISNSQSVLDPPGGYVEATVNKSITIKSIPDIDFDLVGDGKPASAGVQEDFTLIFRGDGSSNIKLNSLQVTANGLWQFSDNTSTKTYNFVGLYLNLSDYYETSLSLKLLNGGTAKLTVLANFTLDDSYTVSKSYDLTYAILNAPTIDKIVRNFSFDVNSVYKGHSCYFNVRFDNNYAHCIVPSFTIPLPNGLTDKDGLDYILFDSFELGYEESVVVSKQVNAILEGNYTVSGVNLVVNIVPVDKAVFGNNWAILSNTNLYPYEIAKLIIKYNVENANSVTDNNYPITIPKTTIQLPNCLKFNHQASKTLVIPEQTLIKNQSFTDEYNVLLDENTRDKVNTVRNNIINVNNDLLTTKLINVTSNPMRPNLSYNFKPLSSIIEFKKDLTVPLEINFVNDSETSAKITNYKIILDSANDIATFEDGSTTLEYRNSTGITVVNRYSLNVPVKILNHSENVTITFICDEAGTSTTQTIYIPTPVNPTYDYETQIEGTNIIYYNEDNHETSRITVKITNTNNVNSTASFRIVLNDGLKFLDDSSELTVENITIESGMTVYHQIPKLIKGTKVGANSFDIFDSNDDLVGYGTINVTVPNLNSKGCLRISHSKFSNNKASTGGAVYNLSNIQYSNSTFTNNQSSNKCPNIYDNGVCRS